MSVDRLLGSCCDLGAGHDGQCGWLCEEPGCGGVVCGSADGIVYDIASVDPAAVLAGGAR